jgi:hypothetical protein
LNLRKDTFLNANSYFSFTSLNCPHSRQNPFIWKAVNNATEDSVEPDPIDVLEVGKAWSVLGEKVRAETHLKIECVY